MAALSFMKLSGWVILRLHCSSLPLGAWESFIGSAGSFMTFHTFLKRSNLSYLPQLFCLLSFSFALS